MTKNFLAALLQPYRGPAIDTLDNQFISFQQLKAKISVIFDDDWHRDGHDRFAENIAMFGGADFKTRFNESREPSATFLSGLEMMAKDVSRRAYEQKSGPFAGLEIGPTSPLEFDIPPESYRRGISQLYERILYRRPTPDEIASSFELLRNIYRSREDVIARDHALEFELMVTDRETNFAQARRIRLPVKAENLNVHQQFVDQTQQLGGRTGFQAGDWSRDYTVTGRS